MGTRSRGGYKDPGNKPPRPPWPPLRPPRKLILAYRISDKKYRRQRRRKREPSRKDNDD